MNLDIIFCIKNIFSLNGLINNIGSYTILSSILISMINTILFYIIEYKKIFININEIIKIKTNKEEIKYNINNIQTNYNDINNNNYKEEKKLDEKNIELYLNKNNPPKKNIKIKDIDTNSLNLNLTNNKLYSKVKINITPNNISSNS